MCSRNHPPCHSDGCSACSKQDSFPTSCWETQPVVQISFPKESHRFNRFHARDDAVRHLLAMLASVWLNIDKTSSVVRPALDSLAKHKAWSVFSSSLCGKSNRITPQFWAASFVFTRLKRKMEKIKDGERSRKRWMNPENWELHKAERRLEVWRAKWRDKYWNRGN